MIHTLHATDLADEMSSHLEELSNDRLSWLMLNNPVLGNLTDWSPEALLLTELLSRIETPLNKGYEPCSFGWVNHSDSQIIDYRH